MPNPQTNVRLSPDTRARAKAAAKDAGLSLSAWIETAVIAYLDGVGDLVSGDSSEIPELKEMVSDLVSRVERLEGTAKGTAPPPPNATPATERTPTRQSSTKAPPPVDGPEYPLADGVNLLTTSQTWEYCLGLGWVSPEGSTSKASWRSWARRNLVPLMEGYGVEPTGYQGKSNAVASYRRVMMPDGV